MEKSKQVLPHSHINKAPTFINWLLTACLLALTTFGLSCSRGALLDSAQAAWDKADYAAAAEYYEQFLKENPESDKAEFARLKVATIYRRDLKQYDRAIEHYIHFIEEFPKSPDIVQARVRLGDCYGLTRNIERPSVNTKASCRRSAMRASAAACASTSPICISN